MQFRARQDELRRDLLHKDASGGIKQRFDHPALHIGEDLQWSLLWQDSGYDPDAEFSFFSRIRNGVTADFDGDTDDELYIGIFGERSLLLEQDGSAWRLPALWDARAGAPPLWDHDGDGIPGFILKREIDSEGKRIKWQWGADALLACSIDGSSRDVIRDPDKVRGKVLVAGDFLGNGATQIAYSAFVDPGFWQLVTLRLRLPGGETRLGFDSLNHIHHYHVADIDGDGRDEHIYEGPDFLRAFGMQQGGVTYTLPDYLSPAVYADIDNDGREEMLFCQGDSMLFGSRHLNVMTDAMSEESQDAFPSLVDGPDQDAWDQMMALRLRDIDNFIGSHPELEPYRIVLEQPFRRQNDPLSVLTGNAEQIRLAIETMPQMLEPRAGYYDAVTEELVSLQFPPEMSPRHIFFGYPQPMAAVESANGEMLVFTCSAGGGLFAFAADGRCSHFEDVGEQIQNLHVLRTTTGDRLVMELADRYMISDLII